jgi:hypothetical protein
VWLIWKYLGRLEAFLFTVSAAVIPTHQTAWSPYLTVFSVAWALILVNILRSNKKYTVKDKGLSLYDEIMLKHKRALQFMLLGLSLSTLFHSQIAFAVVFVPLFLYGLYRSNLVAGVKEKLFGLIGFLVLFVPQLVFEFRHNFLQIKSIIRFVRDFGGESFAVSENSRGLARVVEVAGYVVENAIDSVLPVKPMSLGVAASISLTAIFLLVVVRSIKRVERLKEGKEEKFALVLIIGTFLMYLVLPVKGFYLIGLTPVWIYLFSRVIKRRKIITSFLVILYIVLAIINMNTQKNLYGNLSENSRILYEPKEKAVKAAIILSEGKPFLSYHYVPEIYDFTYQHVYQQMAYSKGMQLPVEYAYAPNVPTYMQTIKFTGSNGKPLYAILIVEEDDRPEFFPAWWDSMTKNMQVEKGLRINDEIMVYRLLPKK